MSRSSGKVIAAAVAAAAITACGAGSARPVAGPAVAAVSHPGPVARAWRTGSVRSLVQSIAERVAAGAGATAGEAGQAVRYRAIQYSSVISNAGTPVAFTAFVTFTRSITVQPTSAARIHTTVDGPPRFPSAADRGRWQAAGRPPLTGGAGTTVSLPPGTYSFLAQGSTLTYKQAASLPASPTALAAQVTARLRAYAGPDPAAGLVLKQLAYLIATAPLSTAARSAAWRAIAAQPGLRRCGAGADPVGRHGLALCANVGDTETQILVNPGTCAILAIQERLLHQTPLYPFIPVSGLTSSNTFLTP